MSGVRALAIGRYDDWDRAPMAGDFALTEIAGPGDLTRLDESTRAAVRIVFYKSHHPFAGAEMDALPALGLIANYGVGYDAIDVAAARARGIRVSNTPDVLTDEVADLALAMLISRARRMHAAEDWLRSGRWATEGEFPLSRRATGRRAGILGLGRIGRAIAERLAACGSEIHYFARAPKQTPDGWRAHPDPVSLASAADDLIVAVPGGPETAGLVDAHVLQALGQDGIVVNIARGSVIDEPALIAALERGTIRGAALDVFTTEPTPDPRFLALDNVLLLPHIGSATCETRQAMGALQRENAAAFLAGRDLPTAVA